MHVEKHFIGRGANRKLNAIEVFLCASKRVTSLLWKASRLPFYITSPVCSLQSELFPEIFPASDGGLRFTYNVCV